MNKEVNKIVSCGGVDECMCWDNYTNNWKLDKLEPSTKT